MILLNKQSASGCGLGAERIAIKRLGEGFCTGTGGQVSLISVISGRALILIGRPVVPSPRLT